MLPIVLSLILICQAVILLFMACVITALRDLCKALTGVVQSYEDTPYSRGSSR